MSCTRKKVQFLERLNIDIINENEICLLLVEVKGKSSNEYTGIPKLIPVNNKLFCDKDGIIGFDFVIQLCDKKFNPTLYWELRSVYDLSHLNTKFIGVKVAAKNNADIILI